VAVYVLAVEIVILGGALKVCGAAGELGGVVEQPVLSAAGSAAPAELVLLEPLLPHAVRVIRAPVAMTATRERRVQVVIAGEATGSRRRTTAPRFAQAAATPRGPVRPDKAPRSVGRAFHAATNLQAFRPMIDLGHTALGAWSGGRFMHFGLPLDDERYLALIRPDERIRTLITADVYGTGAADEMVGRAIADLPRDSYRLVAAIGHDFYEGVRDGAKGFPRFTDPRLRPPGEYADYLLRACEASLERCGVDHFDLLMLHNPDRIGYSSPVVWETGMARLREQGLAGALGVAPGPANGFTLDILRCLERFGDLIDWAMIILNPFEPWPGRMVLPGLAAADVRVIARVVDYGGVFHDDLPDEDMLAPNDHRAFRPAGWVGQARARLDQLRAIGARHGLTPLQLACQWTLAQPTVECVVPTLIQEPGPGAKPVEQKREELASVPSMTLLTAAEIDAINAVGENAGCMPLKGGSPVHAGDELPDAWPLDDDLRRLAHRWEIVPERDLVQTH